MRHSSSRIESFEPRICFALPTPWAETDIGTGIAAGGGMLAAGTFSLNGAGDIADGADKLRFAYQPLIGDGYVIARVADIQASDPLAEVGVMIRDNLTPGAKFADMTIREDGETHFGFRLSNGYRVYDRPATTPPATNWVKLARRRNMLTGYTSADGVNWTSVGSETVSMSVNAYVGLFVTSHNATAINATFDGVVIPQNILNFGASVTANDNVGAIQNAITASSNSGNAIYVPPGVFKTANLIELTGGKRLFGAGPFGVSPFASDQVSTILSTNVNAAPIRLSGSGARLNDLAVTSNYTGGRLSADKTTAIYADTASNFVISGVEVMKSASGGIMISHGAANGTITNNRVHDTLADGIHMTNGAHDMLVENNVVYSTGDDLIAAVGYANKFSPSGLPWESPSNITIRNNTVTNTGKTNGRGIAAVGAKNLLIDNNTITDAPHSGIIIVSENSYSSLAGDQITVTRNRIVNPNTQNLSGATGNHGGIYIGGRLGFPITNIRIGDPVDPTKGNTITNVKGGGITIAGYTSNIGLYNNTIDQTTGYGIRAYSTADITVAGNTVKRSNRQGLYLHNANAGVFSITNNVFENVNTSNTSGNDVIYVAAGGNYASLTITGNAYTNPLNYVVDRFIECHFASAIANNNTTNTGKTIYVGA